MGSRLFVALLLIGAKQDEVMEIVLLSYRSTPGKDTAHVHKYLDREKKLMRAQSPTWFAQQEIPAN